MLRFKTPDLRQEFEKINPKLRVILYAGAGFLETCYSAPLTITDLLRPDGSKSDPHLWGNAADTRTRTLKPDEIEALIDFINTHIDYGDFKHLVLVDERKPLEGPKGKRWSAEHLHWQVRKNTVMLRKVKSAGKSI